MRLHSEMNSGVEYGKDIKRRCKSNKFMKSRTINTEVRIDKKYKKGKNDGGDNIDLIKKFGTKYNGNNVDDILLHMFLKQKYSGKNYNQNSFRK